MICYGHISAHDDVHTYNRATALHVWALTDEYADDRHLIWEEEVDEVCLKITLTTSMMDQSFACGNEAQRLSRGFCNHTMGRSGVPKCCSLEEVRVFWRGLWIESFRNANLGNDPVCDAVMFLCKCSAFNGLLN